MKNLPKKVKKLNYLLYFIPVIVFLFEYIAISSAVAYARFIVEIDQPVISLLGGLIHIGRNLPYESIPDVVVSLHLTALVLSVVFFVYYMFFYQSSNERQHHLPPQEG